MTQIASNIRFTAKLLRPAAPARASWTFLILPKDASAKAPRVIYRSKLALTSMWGIRHDFSHDGSTDRATDRDEILGPLGGVDRARPAALGGRWGGFAGAGRPPGRPRRG